MGRLVSQILDMSLLQSNAGMVLNLGVVDVVDMLKSAVSDANFSYPGSDLQLSAPVSLTVNADSDRLAQLLSNLISNARHHGTPGRAVTLFADGDDEQVVFGVVNAGEPIPDDVQVDLFKAFKPGLRINERNRTGLGLGLYIAHEIAVAHGGTLAYTSGSGLIYFTVTLPRQ